MENNKIVGVSWFVDTLTIFFVCGKKSKCIIAENGNLREILGSRILRKRIRYIAPG